MKKQNEFEKKTTGLEGKDLLAAMNYLDEELVELQPKSAKKAQKLFWRERPAGTVLKWAAAAFALCFIGGSVAFAASRLSVSILDEKDSNGNNRYKLEYVADQVSEEELTGEVQQVKAQFMEDAANGIFPAEDNIPRGFVKGDFATEQEVIDYIGYAGLRETMLNVGELWIKPIVAVFGDRDGNLTHVAYHFARKIKTEKEIEHFEVYQEAEIHTTKYSHDFMGYIDSVHNSDAFQKYEYVTKSGNNALILVLNNADQIGQTLVEGYVIEGAVVYSIRISHNFWTEKDTTTVESLMKQWLEQF